MQNTLNTSFNKCEQVEEIMEKYTPSEFNFIKSIYINFSKIFKDSILIA